MTDEDPPFDLDPSTSSSLLSSTASHSTTKPKDDFSTPPLAPYTLFYLSITAPHTDSYTLIGPAKSFLHLLPKIWAVVSNSPSAIDKLDALQRIEDVWGESEPNLDFEERGFKVFVVQGQRNTYTVLRVLREVNRAVYEELPAPVYVLTSHGPLHNILSAEVPKRGVAATSAFVGSFVEKEETMSKAREVLKEMTKGMEGVSVSEMWEKEEKAGVLMALTVKWMWEIRIRYENQVLTRAKEGSEREGKNVRWRSGI